LIRWKSAFGIDGDARLYAAAAPIAFAAGSTRV